jgi:lysophospholipase L1-like esterase
MTAPFRQLSLIVLMVGLTASAADQPRPIKIAIIGDSTVSTYKDDSPLRGWGQVIGEFLTPQTKVLNLAKSGASTKTFLTLSNWKQALDAKPDFLFIQFGHNDSHGSAKPEATSADRDYADNLRHMVAEARRVGATPVLVTPMHRRSFKDGQPTEELKPYADSMKRVAKEQNVCVIDLYTLSGEMFSKLGDKGSEDLTNTPGKDRTHFTPKGARAIAGMVAKAAADCDPRLKQAVKSGDPTPVSH